MNPLSQAPGPVITIEGIVIDVIVHREPKAPPEEGVPEFLEHGAMIDTGASDTCIDYRIAHALKLRQIDQRTIGTVGGPIQVAVYLGVLEIPQLKFNRLDRFFAPKIERINYSVLIGRSVLREFLFTTMARPTSATSRAQSNRQITKTISLPNAPPPPPHPAAHRRRALPRTTRSAEAVVLSWHAAAQHFLSARSRTRSDIPFSRMGGRRWSRSGRMRVGASE